MTPPKKFFELYSGDPITPSVYCVLYINILYNCISLCTLYILYTLYPGPGHHSIIEVFPFWFPQIPREIRLKKLNVSPILYCNVLSLTVYFIGILMY